MLGAAKAPSEFQECCLTMSTRVGKSLLRRSKTSLNSLTGLTGQKIERTITLPLQEYHAESSCCPSSLAQPTLQRQASSISCSTVSVDGSVNDTIESSALPNKTLSLFPWVAALALLLQIPQLLEEIHIILDLHYHSFPLLVVLGSFSCVLKRPRKIRADRSSDSSFAERDSFCDSKALYTLGDLVDRLEYQGRTHPQRSVDVHEDEWGHFTELEEDPSSSSYEQHRVPSGPRRRSILAPLPESEEEE